MMTESGSKFYRFFDKTNNITIIFEKDHWEKAEKIYQDLMVENKKDVKIFVESPNISLHEEYEQLKKKQNENH